MTMNLDIARLFNEKGCGTAVGCPQKIKILFKTKLPIAEQILTHNITNILKFKALEG